VRVAGQNHAGVWSQSGIDVCATMEKTCGMR
jgi:hypothetical protein